MTLANLKDSDCFVVSKVKVNGEIGMRLMDMGVNKGVKGRVIRHAPLGDPIVISIRGYELSIRLSEAEGITVLPIDNELYN